MADSQEHPRLILHNFLSLSLCKELEFIHKSCCTVGYRPNVFSTTLSHLIATNSAHLIMPLIPIRERLKEKVEEHFGCEYELVVEFTGLVSWCTGASIGWHSDDNRDYLKQRDFAAVCYLNSYGVDFKGGLFQFQDGEPSTVAPMAGDVIMYTADDKNVHSVNKITEGERITLTLWFSRDASHDEDSKLLTSLSEYQEYASRNIISSYFPLQASNNMYWFPADQASRFQSGFDIRCTRLHILGFGIASFDEKSCLSKVDDSSHFLNLLKNPLYLARKDFLLVQKFVNILHALQVMQFCYWKILESEKTELKEGFVVNLTPLSGLQSEKSCSLKAIFLKDIRLAETVFGSVDGKGKRLEWPFDISYLVHEWEVYSNMLGEKLVKSLPYWQTNQAIFYVVNLQ